MAKRKATPKKKAAPERKVITKKKLTLKKREAPKIEKPPTKPKSILTEEKSMETEQQDQRVPGHR